MVDAPYLADDVLELTLSGAAVSTLPPRLLMIGIEVANSSPPGFFFPLVTRGR